MASLNMAQRRAIDLAKEDLVTRAETLLEQAQVVQLNRSDFGDSQMRNLIAVAMETESPKVVVNFIRYQVGRDTRERSWNSKQGDKTLGQRRIDEIDGDNGAIEQAVAGIPGLDGKRAETQLARIELIRNFLGFATRYLKYLDLQREKGRSR